VGNHVLLLKGPHVLLPLITFLMGNGILIYCDFVFTYTIIPMWDLVGVELLIDVPFPPNWC
jgi:hypothetical protein